MGKLVVIAMTSVDGYYEGPGGAGDPEPTGVDDGFNAYNADAVQRADAVVIGHKSFKDFSVYWPDRETAGDASDAQRRFAGAYNLLPKVVFSHDPSSVQVPEKWHDNTRIVSQVVDGEVSRLREQSDGDIAIWGSRSLWTQLWDAGLVDELHLVAGTAVAGDGTPIFPVSPGMKLTPLEARLLPDSSCVLTTYSVH